MYILHKHDKTSGDGGTAGFSVGPLVRSQGDLSQAPQRRLGVWNGLCGHSVDVGCHDSCDITRAVVAMVQNFRVWRIENTYANGGRPSKCMLHDGNDGRMHDCTVLIGNRENRCVVRVSFPHPEAEAAKFVTLDCRHASRDELGNISTADPLERGPWLVPKRAGCNHINQLGLVVSTVCAVENYQPHAAHERASPT